MARPKRQQTTYNGGASGSKRKSAKDMLREKYPTQKQKDLKRKILEPVQPATRKRPSPKTNPVEEKARKKKGEFEKGDDKFFEKGGKVGDSIKTYSHGGYVEGK